MFVQPATITNMFEDVAVDPYYFAFGFLVASPLIVLVVFLARICGYRCCTYDEKVLKINPRLKELNEEQFNFQESKEEIETRKILMIKDKVDFTKTSHEVENTLS